MIITSGSGPSTSHLAPNTTANSSTTNPTTTATTEKYNAGEGISDITDTSDSHRKPFPLLEEYNASCRAAVFEAEKAHLFPKHPSTLAFERHLHNTTILELADFWFCQGSPYDHVCLARDNWRFFDSPAGWEVGDFFTRAELHSRLYAYVARRTACIGILLERGYDFVGKPSNQWLGPTDAVFGFVVREMVVEWDRALPASIFSWAERGRPRTLMLEGRLLRAVEVVLATVHRKGEGRRRVPMRFRVRRKEGEGAGTKAVVSLAEQLDVMPTGKGKGKEKDKQKEDEVLETAFFWFTEDGDGGNWEVDMEIVETSREAEDAVFHPRGYDLMERYN